MAATTTKAESQQLLTKADWPEWYSSVTRRAKRDKIWEYCNPDLPQEGSATASSSAATRADTLAATTSTTASFHRELIEPIRPTARQVNPQATLLTDLTDEELKRWTLLKDDYNERMREYNKKWKVISELDDYIESTLDRSNHTIIKDLDTPYEKLQALKQRLEPNPNQLKQAARAAYDSAQKWNSRTKLEQWVRTYRNAYQEAKLAQLALVDDFNPHYDFVKVIAQVNPACASVLQGSLVKLQQTGQDPPDFVKSCLEFFEGWQHTQPATQSGVTHTGFATFQGQQSQPTQASTQSNQSTQQNAQPGHQAAGRGRGRGRGRGGQGGQWNSTRSTCKFCTGRHQSERCYYVDPRQRTPNWQESPHYREQYNQILTSYPALRQEAEAIRSKPVPTSQYQSANQSSNQSSNAASTPVVGNDPSKQQEGTKHSAVQPPPMNALFRLSTSDDQQELESSLLHCWILDPGADVNVCNNLANFTWERPALPSDQLMASGSYLKIQAWGRATITVEGPHGPKKLLLHQVAYIPSFFTSLVSLSQGAGIHFNSGENLVYMGIDRTPVCYTIRRGGH